MSTRRFRELAGLGGLVATSLLVSGCSGEETPGCKTDLECKGDRICVAGECMDDWSGWPVWDSGHDPLDGRVPSDGPDEGFTDGGPTDASGGAVQDAGPVPERAVVVDPKITSRYILADRNRRRIYATVESRSEKYPNELVTIDGESGEVLHHVPIGSEPTTLAMSNDGTTLWVSITGAYAIRRVGLTGALPEPAEQRELPTNAQNERVSAGPMVVLPGTTRSLAISLHKFNYSPSFAGAVILDDGVPRGMPSDASRGAAQLVAGPKGYLLGYNDQNTEYGFYVLKVDDKGFTQTFHEGLFSGFKTRISYSEGIVYGTSGQVVDISAPDAPKRLGVFPFTGLILPLPQPTRLLMLSSTLAPGVSASPFRLRRLSIETFTEIDSRPIQIQVGGFASSFEERNLVQVDSTTFAFLFNESDKLPSPIYILRLSSSLE